MRTAPSEPLERIGHRGTPSQMPENTLEGFLLAIDQGADAVELDVHVSDDGIVVVHHDEAVDTVDIASTDWETLLQLGAGMDLEIPTLEDVLRAIGDRATVYIELKGARVEREVIEMARRHGSRYAVHSFDHDAIARAARIAPDVPRGVLIDRGTTNPIQAMQRAVGRAEARDVWSHWSLVSADMMRAAEELGVRVLVWTVNSPETARHMRSLGAAGICTDDVRMLANL